MLGRAVHEVAQLHREKEKTDAPNLLAIGRVSTRSSSLYISTRTRVIQYPISTRESTSERLLCMYRRVDGVACYLLQTKSKIIKH